MAKVKGFLDVDPQYRELEPAKFVILPVPYERTTTYGKGTKNGPAAILAASQQIETFDEELLQETYRKGSNYVTRSLNLKNLPTALNMTVDAGKIPITLGGEHSITPVIVETLVKKFKDLSVLQLDAHADLRDSYQGSKNSHACAMRRTLTFCPVVQVGIRNLAEEEYLYAKNHQQLDRIHFAAKPVNIASIVNQLSETVYITIDVDVFDPSLVPGTGTPEPGGFFWYQVLEILREVCANKKIIGFDVVELAPIKGLPASDFTAAKLIYRLMGYLIN